MTNKKKMNTVHINAPVTKEALSTLKQGDIVLITGKVYTAREGVYKKVVEDREPLPIDLQSISNINFHCSPAASQKEDGSFNVGAVTATASFRFEKWMPELSYFLFKIWASDSSLTSFFV